MKHIHTIIAIDPGASGGIALFEHGTYRIKCHPMPKALSDFRIAVEDIIGINEPNSVLAVVEDVPKFVAGMQTSAAGMAKLHQNYGYILGVLDANGVSVKTIRPQEWQKKVGAGDKKTYGTRWKAHLKDLAARRFPMLGKYVTLKTADALLILSTELD